MFFIQKTLEGVSQIEEKATSECTGTKRLGRRVFLHFPKEQNFT